MVFFARNVLFQKKERVKSVFFLWVAGGGYDGSEGMTDLSPGMGIHAGFFLFCFVNKYAHTSLSVDGE